MVLVQVERRKWRTDQKEWLEEQLPKATGRSALALPLGPGLCPWPSPLPLLGSDFCPWCSPLPLSLSWPFPLALASALRPCHCPWPSLLSLSSRWGRAAAIWGIALAWTATCPALRSCCQLAAKLSRQEHWHSSCCWPWRCCWLQLLARLLLVHACAADHLQ